MELAGDVALEAADDLLVGEAFEWPALNLAISAGLLGKRGNIEASQEFRRTFWLKRESTIVVPQTGSSLFGGHQVRPLGGRF
jgi:hypothetical protein